MTAAPEVPGQTDAVTARTRTPLLTLISAEALERDYQMVALRRVQQGGSPSRRGGWLSGGLGVITIVAVFGFLVTLAAVQTSRNADVTDASRATLIDRIDARRAAVRSQQRAISDLRDDNTKAEADLIELNGQVNDVEGDATDLGAVTGFTPVVGEGIRIQLDNAPYADPDTEHIRDSDLAMLVNALWTAGAEAIAINGQRISSRTAIRNSGTAIEVNSIGIAPPYVVQAIGNVNTLSSRVVESGSGASFGVLAGDYGWSYDVDNVAELRLPAAPARLRQLRSAEQASQGGRAPEGDG
ncbi:DUF881 domain-containing protein [Nocardioides humilatus]|uniref:DUF881 domain-containing protein n=1 Tax=Nocardioides humilatus TaxID=2607660 RepID=A0A5B1L883_9ACTN|nr:DUF881 domain-containing protein [Nocardioides humilatus]KAA1415939.1 DUF881 domain-containing protein [Nocardioides humilatus]